MVQKGAQANECEGAGWSAGRGSKGRAGRAGRQAGRALALGNAAAACTMGAEQGRISVLAGRQEGCQKPSYPPPPPSPSDREVKSTSAAPKMQATCSSSSSRGGQHHHSVTTASALRGPCTASPCLPPPGVAPSHTGSCISRRYSSANRPRPTWPCHSEPPESGMRPPTCMMLANAAAAVVRRPVCPQPCLQPVNQFQCNNLRPAALSMCPPTCMMLATLPPV